MFPEMGCKKEGQVLWGEMKDLVPGPLIVTYCYVTNHPKMKCLKKKNQKTVFSFKDNDSLGKKLHQGSAEKTCLCFIKNWHGQFNSVVRSTMTYWYSRHGWNSELSLLVCFFFNTKGCFFLHGISDSRVSSVVCINIYTVA